MLIGVLESSLVNRQPICRGRIIIRKPPPDWSDHSYGAEYGEIFLYTQELKWHSIFKGGLMYLKHIAIIIFVSVLSFSLSVASQEAIGEEKALQEKTFTNSLGMKFVLIPAGTFMMGSPPDDPQRDDDESQHRVTISKAFHMQTTEVTQGQWKRVMGNNPSHFKNCGDNCPVETVSWHDVQEFIRKLNQLEGTNKYRLPTEAEWEYACRAGTSTPFYTGKCISTDQANYNGSLSMPGCPKGEYRKGTVSAGSFPPNTWGLYDMHGNVWEWCEDWFGYYPSGHVTDPKGPSSGIERVLRGGSWGDVAWYMRSSGERLRYHPDLRDYDNGFRLARDF